MTEYDNTNRVAIFKNEKRDGDKDPEYTGTVNVDGADYFIDLWVKESSKTGKKFFSGKIKRKGQRP
jgi:hypothetical protein